MKISEHAEANLHELNFRQDLQDQQDWIEKLSCKSCYPVEWCLADNFLFHKTWGVGVEEAPVL